MSVEDDVYFSFQDEALRKILGKLLEKAKAFLNSDYGLKKRVENETDFRSGCVSLSRLYMYIVKTVGKMANPRLRRPYVISRV